MASKRQDTLLRLNGFCVTLTNRFFLSAVFLAMLVLVSLIYALGGEPLLRSFLGTYLIHYDLPPFGDAHGITSASAATTAAAMRGRSVAAQPIAAKGKNLSSPVKTSRP